MTSTLVKSGPSGIALAVDREITDLSDGDLMGDVEMLLIEVARAGFDRRRSAYVSHFVQFGNRTRWEQAVTGATRDGWETAAYSNATGHVVRLSRQVKVSAEQLRDQQRALRRLARKYDGQWDGLSIEQFGSSSYWDEIANGYVDHRCPRERGERRPPAQRSARH